VAAGLEGAFGVDFMVCTDLLTAQAIFRISGLPSAHDVDTFAGGLIRMAEFDIPVDSPIADRTVREADCYDSLTFAAIFRDDEMVVTRGDTVIQAGDRVVVIGSPTSINDFANEVAMTPEEAEEVVIVGASEIGFQTAREFEDHGFRPRLIERDHGRAREVAESLPNTMVMESDATNQEFLAREHVGEADVVIAALDSDEKNLLVSLLADRLGVDRTVAIIENPPSTPTSSRPSASTSRSTRERKPRRKSSGSPGQTTPRRLRCSSTIARKSSRSKSIRRAFSSDERSSMRRMTFLRASSSVRFRGTGRISRRADRQSSSPATT